MRTQLAIGDALFRGAKLAQTSFGQRFIGHLAQPVFANLRDIELQKLEEDDIYDDDSDKPQRSAIENISRTVKENISYGDLISAGGLGMMAIQNKIFPSRSKKPGIFEKAFRFISLATTLGGSLSAMFGRMLNLHKSVALEAHEFADLLSKTAEKNGKPIFSIISQEEKDRLKKEATYLDKILVYPPGTRESILERHEKDEIGGLLDGPPGTGKTDGINCILGKWIARMEAEGKIPEVAKLNLANFDEYLKQMNKGKEEMMEVLQAGMGKGGFAQQSFDNNHGLLILEMLIKRIQSLQKRRDKHNHKNPNQPQELAVFVDEFDKIFDPKTLAGCDKNRLKNLLLQFNELFVKENILLTSNESLEDMFAELKKHLKDGSGHVMKTIINPSYERLASKNRILVDMPGVKEQAEIIAGRLIKEYGEFIDWSDFGIGKPNSGSIETDRKVLGKAIEAITEEVNEPNLSGRQLKYAVGDILGLLIYQARELRSTKLSIPDATWDKLDRIQKIRLTGAKINKAMVKQALLDKANSVKMKHSDPNLKLANTVIEKYLDKNAVKKHQAPPPKNNDELLEFFNDAYELRENNNRRAFISRNEVDHNGKRYKHLILQDEAKGSDTFYDQSNFSLVLEEVDNKEDKGTKVKISSDDLIEHLDNAWSKRKEKSLFENIKEVATSLTDSMNDPSVQGLLTELALAGR